MRRGLDGQTIADRKEIAEHLRTEADYRRDCNGDDTVFDWRHCDFVESAVTAFDIDNLDMRVYGLFDKLADLIDPQSS